MLPVYSASPYPSWCDRWPGSTVWGVHMSTEGMIIFQALLCMPTGTLFSLILLSWGFHELFPPSQPVLTPYYHTVLCSEIHWWDFRLITEFILTTLLGICVQSTGTGFLLLNLHNNLWIGRTGVILHFIIELLDQSRPCDLPKIPE